MQHPSATEFIAQVLVIFLAIGIHEFAHCWFADLAGDPTPRYYGRVTLNLFKHFEPIGSMLILYTCYAGFGIGWGRPAPMDSRKMRNPRWDLFIAVIAGPLSNLMQATIYAAILRICIARHTFDGAISPDGGGLSDFLSLILIFGVLTNISLMLFNLIPFGPLDGHWLLGLLLPDPYRTKWFQFNRRVGMIGLVVVVMGLQLFKIQVLAVPTNYIFRVLVGTSL